MRTAKKKQNLSPSQKIDLAEHGANCHKEATQLLELIHWALFCKRIHKKLRPKERRQNGKTYDLLISKILLEIGGRINDAGFYKGFAAAIDRRVNLPPSAKASAFIGVQIEASKAFGLPAPELKNLKASLAKQGVHVSETTVERAFAEFGGKAKRGRPAK